ncbi:hypothetical protein BWL13_01542 [Microbacterium oleivorans]|uniref:Uncharacterized protein n=1 Tax=Microbacterium oleivorans TaxID=273677 RepID=A0A031G081_9MICO|nr:hypothetical protein BWL13_01542 [Microbacterium oleivorans]EZP29881.1 hypothetical protein BW34_00509 [Microbacterium oleivorans]
MITDITPTGAAFTAFPFALGTVSFVAAAQTRAHTGR